MPLKRCGDGNKGWKWGESGKCYTGPGAREKALTQMRAIKSQSNDYNVFEAVSEIIRTNKEAKE